ncbi:hypothetical protein OIE13_32310 [Streptosporangium sp. NBC_01810]|nr:hypothetical protein [Streptosporangium sp. NBC_01810]WSA25548.1 hypothetical protein OIE13_32310 [Streptosporangium sp. NBC_01810]
MMTLDHRSALRIDSIVIAEALSQLCGLCVSGVTLPGELRRQCKGSRADNEVDESKIAQDSRGARAIATWPTPEPLIICDRTIEGLKAQMREAEMTALLHRWALTSGSASIGHF